MTYPNDAQSAKCTQATATTCTLVPTQSTPITVLGLYMDKAGQAQQLIQCITNGNVFFSAIQAVGVYPQDEQVIYRFPPNTTCVLKTFDATLTHASITWVNYDMNASSSLITTVNGTSIVYGMGIFIFIAFLFFFKDIFNISRYD